MEFFIADTHFYDSNIMLYEHRPFKDVYSMNDAIIDNWNTVVKDTDTVYVLGDFSLSHEKEILEELKGHKILVKGNHDEKSNEEYRKLGFDEVYDKPIILDNFWILSHEPLYINDSMPYANIFGHVHNSPLYKDYSKHHYCVSVERISYTPIAFSMLKDIMINAQQ